MGEDAQDVLTGSDIESLSATGPKMPVESLTGITDMYSSQSERTLRRRVLTSRGLAPRSAFSNQMSSRDRRKSRYGRYVEERPARDQFARSEGSWNDIRDLLQEVQGADHGKKRGIHHKEINIPEETVALLSGMTDTAMQENIWYVPIHNGCRVQVLSPREGDGVHRKAILSGTERVLELVEDHINRAHEQQTSGDPLVDFPKPPVPIFASTVSMQLKNIPVPVIRGVWSFGRGSPIPLEQVEASRSSLHTVKDFAEYIEDLTCARVLTPHEKTHKPRFQHHQLVAWHIKEAFRKDLNYQLLSTAALNRALSFLCHNELLSTARYVCFKAVQVATTDTYNMLLEATARRQDKRAFRRLLHSMSRAHIRPNSRTWLTLLSALITPSEKASLVNYMMQNGHMTDISTIRGALQHTIENSLLVHLESGESIDSFFTLMLESHGADWFSPSLLAQMFETIARLKDYRAMDRLVHICIENYLMIDSDSLTSIVRMFRADVFSAVHYTILLLNRPGFQLSSETYERLFLTAFKACRYNICRVLWRYACMDESVTYDMRQAVFLTLSRNRSIKQDTNDMLNIWRVNAGKVIVGIDLHLERYRLSESIIKDLPSEFRQNPFSYLSSGFKPLGAERDLQLKLAAHLVWRDIEHGAQRYRPLYPLGLMLDAAAVMDREWAGKPRPLTWMLQNALKVSVKRQPTI